MAVPIYSHNNMSLSVQISNGMNSRPHEFPFMANIRQFENNIHVCGGTIISTMLIITAAHCLERSDEDYSNYLVVAGQHNLNVIDKSVEQKRKISKVHIHPNYIPGNKRNPPYDIAVIVLKEPLKFNQKINCLIPLTNSFNASSGKFGRIVGWGEVGRGESSPILRKAYIELMNRKMCNGFLNLIHGHPFLNIYDSIICGTKSLKSICSGDSGGPMICKNNRGHNSLCGISAFSPDSCGQGIEIESYFTSVSYFYSWIKHNPMRDLEILSRNGESQDSTVMCGNEEFLCSNENKIPSLFHCDNENDCGDTSDEIGCYPCGENEFKCKNDKCMAEEKVCNSQNDCGDGSDEFGCEKFCHQTFFLCSSQRYCLNGSSICDGSNDCHDGSDEANCGNCQINQFRCKNGNCVDLSHVCDYENDCKDGSDEMNCENCKNQFRCKNDRCIPYGSVCNEVNDCKDGSDEIDCSKCFPNCKESKPSNIDQQTTPRTTRRTTRIPQTTTTTTETDQYLSEDLSIARELRETLERKGNMSLDERTYLTEWLNKNSDLILINFIKYAGYDMEGAEKQILKTLNWRMENEIENILQREFPSDFPDRYPWRITGFTNENKPVLYMEMGNWNIREAASKGQKEELLKWVTQMLEFTTVEASKKIDPSSGLPVGNFYFIIDFNNFRSTLVSSVAAIQTAGKYYRIIVSAFALYPTNVFIIRGPTYFPHIFWHIKSFLTQATVETIIVTGPNEKDWKPPLIQRIPIDALPIQLGGKN